MQAGASVQPLLQWLGLANQFRRQWSRQLGNEFPPASDAIFDIARNIRGDGKLLIVNKLMQRVLCEWKRDDEPKNDIRKHQPGAQGEYAKLYRLEIHPDIVPRT